MLTCNYQCLRYVHQVCTNILTPNDLTAFCDKCLSKQTNPKLETKFAYGSDAVSFGSLKWIYVYASKSIEQVAVGQSPIHFKSVGNVSDFYQMNHFASSPMPIFFENREYAQCKTPDDLLPSSCKSTIGFKMHRICIIKR